MFRINRNQYIARNENGGFDFFHRVSSTVFVSENADDYSQLHANGFDYFNDLGRAAVENSSHIFYNFV